MQMNILTPTVEVHGAAQLPLLNDRRDYHVKLLAHKRVYSGKDNTRAVERVTRANQAPLLFYNIIHTTSYEHSPQVRCGQMWNDMPPEIRLIESVEEFKTKAKEVLDATVPCKL